jgi:hypothetical protein
VISLGQAEAAARELSLGVVAAQTIDEDSTAIRG